MFTEVELFEVMNRIHEKRNSDQNTLRKPEAKNESENVWNKILFKLFSGYFV